MARTVARELDGAGDGRAGGTGRDAGEIHLSIVRLGRSVRKAGGLR